MWIREEKRPLRILFLSFYFPPSRASGVYRARAIANYLAECGWEVTAFAAPVDFFNDVNGSTDERLAATVDDRVRIERPQLSRFAWQREIRQYGYFRRTFPRSASNLYRLTQKYLFPEHYATWGLAAVAKALRLHARRRFDVVLATGNPFSSFGAAWRFKRLTRVPYMLDYRDSWTLNQFTELPAFSEGHPAFTWEDQVLASASGVSFVNKAQLEWHAGRYPHCRDKMVVIPNGWDRDLTPVATDPAEQGSPSEYRPLRFSFLGTVTLVQPLEELAEAFRLARGHTDLADAELLIYGHLGFFRNDTANLAGRLGIDNSSVDQVGSGGSGIRYLGAVSKVDVGEVYRNSDVLVFLTGGSRYVTTGKIFEYMAAGLPIVSVHAPGVAAEEVLRGYPLWFNAGSLDPHDIAQSMIAAGKAARDVTAEQQKAARQHAEAFARDILLAPLESRLRAIASRGALMLESAK